MSTLWTDGFKRPVGQRVWDATVNSMQHFRDDVKDLLTVYQRNNRFCQLVMTATQDVTLANQERTPKQSDNSRLRSSESIIKSLLSVIEEIKLPEFSQHTDKVKVELKIADYLKTATVCYEYYFRMVQGNKRKDKDCQLSLMLAQFFDKTIARRICVLLGATRREDFPFVNEKDIDDLKMNSMDTECLKGIILPPKPPPPRPTEPKPTRPLPTGPKPIRPRPQPAAAVPSFQNSLFLAQMRACLQAMPL